MNIDNYMLKRDDSMVLVIDIQERLLAAMKEKIQEKVVKNTAILLEAAKVFSMPVVISEQYRKGLGPTVEKLIDTAESPEVLEKLHFDCCRDEGLCRVFDIIGRNTVIITGIEAHVCVFQTALSFLRQGKNVVIASDAVSSRRKHDWKTALSALTQAGALVYPTETIAFLLLEKAGTDAFKKLSPLFK